MVKNLKNIFNCLVESNKTMMDISVIICTYNRCESLKDTLNSLLAQETNGLFNYEVSVVDNNSKDRTKDVIAEFAPRFNGKLKYVFEAKQGISFARNKGIEEAKGGILAFTDDDCLPENKWLLKIYHKFQESNAPDFILGGALWEDGKPIHTERNILRGNGLNMCFRKKVVERIGAFDTFLGAGSIGYSADDTEFMYRATLTNSRIHICDEIIVVHKHRINEKEKLEIVSRDTKGYIIFWLKYVIKKHDIFAIKNIYWVFLGLFRSLLQEIKRRNYTRVKIRIIQLTAVLVGVIKGIYIWLILVPVYLKCQK